MNIWLRRYIGLTGIGGGLVGLMNVVGYTSKYYSQLDWSWNWLTAVFFLIFYAWIMGIGFLVQEGRQSRAVIFQAFITQLVQLPIFTLPFLKYGIFSGFHLDIIWTLPLNISILFDVASRATFRVSQPGDSISLGINIAALVTAYLLWRVLAIINSENSIGQDSHLKQEKK